MSAKPIKKLVVKTGEYVDRSGQTKGRWQNVGTLFKHDDGSCSIKIDSIPIGHPNWEGWCMLFDFDDKSEQQPQQQRRQPQNQQPPHEEIPF